MKFSPNDFWDMTLHEATLAIKGDKERQEGDLMIYYFAHMNAIAGCLSKNHKFINPFDKKGKEKPKTKTAKELKNELDDMIKNWR